MDIKRENRLNEKLSVYRIAKKKNMKKLNAPFLLKYICPLFGFFDNDSTLEFKKKN